MKRKRCAVCMDTHQTNVKMLWKRESDGVIFHVCLACAEAKGVVNAKSVQMKDGKSFTTYLSDEEAKELDLASENRPKRRGSTKVVVAKRGNK